MTMNQMKYALVVSRASSMREAASNLFVSQPALSSAIRDLEEELGILIFERTNKGIKVTRAGEEFLMYAKKAISQFEIIEDKYAAEKGAKAHFAISTQHYNFAIRAFSKVIKGYDSEKYVFAIHETRTAKVLEHVRDLVSEIGVVSYSDDNEAIMRKLMKEYSLEFEPLMKCDTYAYFWQDHPLANREMVSLEELRRYPCITFEQRSDKGFYLNEEALANVSFDKLIKSDDRATSMELIAQLGGYSIGSGMLASEDVVLQGLSAVRLKEQDPLTIGYIKRAGSTLSELGSLYEQELRKLAIR